MLMTTNELYEKYGLLFTVETLYEYNLGRISEQAIKFFINNGYKSITIDSLDTYNRYIADVNVYGK